ncbi:nucleoside diphosphate kinase, partial [Arapaima gigas]
LNVVNKGRVMLGETNPADSELGSFHGDFCIQAGGNIIHGSDFVGGANREINLWQLVTHRSCAHDGTYE